jgi:hypothetical protein
MRFATVAQVAALASAIAPRYRALILVAAYGGLRWGELVGLRVKRVDLRHGRVTVAEQVSEVNGQLIPSPPKTEAGRRTVTLPAVAAVALAEHLAEYAEHGADGLVFPGPEGGYLRRSNFRRRWWLRATRAAGVEGLRFHDLRHSAATLALAAGSRPTARSGTPSPGSSPRSRAATVTPAGSSARWQGSRPHLARMGGRWPGRALVSLLGPGVRLPARALWPVPCRRCHPSRASSSRLRPPPLRRVTRNTDHARVLTTLQPGSNSAHRHASAQNPFIPRRRPRPLGASWCRRRWRRSPPGSAAARHRRRPSGACSQAGPHTGSVHTHPRPVQAPVCQLFFLRN